MCHAVAAFTGVGRVRLLAPDPWAIAAGLSGRRDHAEGLTVEGPSGDAWQIAAEVLFLASVIISRGEDHPTVVANLREEPEATNLALQLRSSDPSGALPQQLVAIWPGLLDAAQSRAQRLSGRL